MHIHTPVEFEKIIDGDWPQSVNLTRERMAVQQLLDSRESTELLVTRLLKYSKSFTTTFDHIRNNQWEPLLKQPSFNWSIDGRVLSSTAWNFEKNNIHITLGKIYKEEGDKHVAHQEYKEASQQFNKASQHYERAYDALKRWKWKLPSENHYIISPKWQCSQIENLKALHQLCTLSVGIGKNATDKTLYTIAQRGVKHAALSQIHYYSENSLLHLCETIRYLYSSNIQWNKGKYGASIDTVQRWVTPIETAFMAIKQEFEKIPLLTRERQLTNNNVYFDIVKPGASLPTLPELIDSTIDLDHP